MKCFIITSLLILTILGSTGLAIEEHVLMLAGQEVRFTAVPEEGYILKDKDGRMKARNGVAESAVFCQWPEGRRDAGGGGARDERDVAERVGLALYQDGLATT